MPERATTGLRFFTVYGPWGRPDMALFKFTRLILEGKPIPVFNHGNHTRAFTYVDDIVEAVIRASDDIARPNEAWDSENPDPSTSSAPYRILNIGGNHPVKLFDYIRYLENALGKTAQLELLPMQPGDVKDTWADTEDLAADVGYQSSTTIEVGVKKFVEWYLEFYEVELDDT